MSRSLRSLAAVLAVGLLALSASSAADLEPFGDETSSVQFGRDRTMDVAHYFLDLTFDPDSSKVAGTLAVTASPLNDGLTLVELDAGPMEIHAVRLAAVENPPDLTFEHDGRNLRVRLPRPFDAGESLTLEIDYEAQPEAGLYFVGPDEGYPDRPSQVWSQGEAEDNHLWFPSFDYPNDRATSEQRYTVPSNWTAVGNGALIESEENAEAGTRTFHYEMNVPHVSYLVSVVAGEFEKYEQSYGEIPVEYYVPPGTGKETTFRSFDVTPNILEFFSEKTGVPYPYEKYSQACAEGFIFGGMENISATTQTAATLHDARAALEFDSWGLVAHEAAHQWFGNLLTCADWSQAWLNEGFATYWENLWREHYQGEEEFLWTMLKDRDAYLKEDREDYRRPIVHNRYTDPMDLFDAHLYPKGAWTLHMLRGVLGDERFFRAIAHYTASKREQVVETHDLRRAIAESTGVDLQRFFDQWLHSGGHPELKVTRNWYAAEGALQLRFEQTQQVDELTPLFQFPLHVEVITDQGVSRHMVRIDGTVNELTIRLNGEPRLVRIDPDFRLLMELDHQRPIGETLAALEGDPSPIGRIFAARDLAERASAAESSAGLVATLAGDPFYGVRAEAATALGAVGGDVAEAGLISGLADQDARVRKAAATALGELEGSVRSAEALEGLIARDQAYGPVAEAVLALAKIDADGALAAARVALRTDSYREQIRSAGLEALAELGDPDAWSTLADWTAYGRPPDARTAAIESLARVSGDGQPRTEAIELLLRLLDDRYIWARREAMLALAEIGATEALPALARSARTEPDSRLRRTARKAARTISDAGAKDRTIEKLAAEIDRLKADAQAQEERIELLEKQ